MPDTATSPARGHLALAAEQRVQVSPEFVAEQAYARQRNTRQAFRRLVDPGLSRGNMESTVQTTLNTLLKIADNILNNPEDEKYRQFKPTNTLIKRTLVDVKGGLEYAVALGFRAEVVNFQPLYIFHPNPKRLEDLQIGADVLREFVERKNEEADRVAKGRADEKAAAARAAEIVRLAYEEDRKAKKMRDDMERQRRDAVARVAASTPIDNQLEQAEPVIATTRLVGGRSLGDPNGPPPYEDNGEESLEPGVVRTTHD